jgi:Domain of unknown function (DUF4277)
MAVAVQTMRPVAHLPLVLGVLRHLEVATIVDSLIPPHPAHGLSCGRGVEALVLAILDGDHALYKVGRRLEERGMLALLQPELTRAALNDYRLGHILDALFAANLNKVFSAAGVTDREFYDLHATQDPYQIESLHNDPSPARVWQQQLKQALDALKSCGQGTRQSLEE